MNSLKRNGDYVVLEGNSRLAAYRLLAEKDPVKWQEWVDGECFLLEAYGDSMVDIGIDEGDLILVKKTETAGTGDVVVALTERGNTLKRLF